MKVHSDLTTIFSKVIEIVLLLRYDNILTSVDNQFVFKSSHSTDLCLYVFKQIIQYYVNKSSPVYTCFIDASKAFDRVNHDKLFQKLIDKKVPIYIVRLIVYWYSNQTFVVKWGDNISDPFTVRDKAGFFHHIF